ncbi:unnamed protein product [Clonostachys rosea]|uniref:Uncharacterized protein n=1 Tax=Bionectria ochroleuca TaxID=29856 RepID=A0ABY6UWK9_BIOOC|nr:unnamed protein product [Clonostachys rosea]
MNYEHSSAIYVLGAGLYSWYFDYSQKCLETEDCQRRAFEVQQSFDLWVYSLCTKAIVEMVTPYKDLATLAKDNVKGFLSSILAWLQGSKEVSGPRPFPGFQLYTENSLRNVRVPDLYKKALSSSIFCDGYVQWFQQPSYRGSIENSTLVVSIYDEGRADSLATWFTSVETLCQGYNVSQQLPLTPGGRIWASVNETCVKDSKTGVYSSDVIDKFSTVSTIQDMPLPEMCSECYIKRLAMMQNTSYSVYDDWYKEDLELVYERCGKEGPTEIPPSLDPVSEKIPTFCVSDNTIETSKGNNTCEETALHNNASPAALYSLKPDIQDCSGIADRTKLCLPLACASLVKYAKNDTCTGLEREGKLCFGDLRRFNPWINFECNNLEAGGKAFGWGLYTEPQNDRFDNWGVGGSGDTVTPILEATTLPFRLTLLTTQRQLKTLRPSVEDDTVAELANIQVFRPSKSQTEQVALDSDPQPEPLPSFFVPVSGLSNDFNIRLEPIAIRTPRGLSSAQIQKMIDSLLIEHDAEAKPSHLHAILPFWLQMLLNPDIEAFGHVVGACSINIFCIFHNVAVESSSQLFVGGRIKGVMVPKWFDRDFFRGVTVGEMMQRFDSLGKCLIRLGRINRAENSEAPRVLTVVEA